MYTIIAKWTILPGNENEALTALEELGAQMQALEPDTLAYLCQVPDFSQASLPTPPAGEVVFFEIYKDEAAFDAHLAGPTFQNFVKNYGSLFLNNESKPFVNLEILSHVAGYVRPGFLD